MSLLETAKRHQLNSEKYLSYLLECLPNEETLVNKEVLEAFILKSTFTNLFPHLFNGVHLWCVWRNKGKTNISRNL
ncbi:transposase [Streptococcus pneumoniae]|nr:transposase [Streptococcus pneumoniae]